MATPQEKRDRTFIKAAGKDDVAGMRAALEAGANIEGKGGFWQLEFSALSYAALLDKTKAVRFLIEQGANINVVDNTGDVPLGHAASNGNAAMVEMLLAAGAKTNIRNGKQRSPYDIAARKGHTKVGALIMQESIRRQAKLLKEKEAAAVAAVAPPAPEVKDPNIIVFRSDIGTRRIEEVFNFEARERTTLVSKPDGPVEAVTRQSFAEMDGSPLLQKAFNEHKSRGGTCTEIDILGAPAKILKIPGRQP